MCVYGPDKYGSLREDVVAEEEAFLCDDCKCRLTEIECIMGPDINGKFYRSETSWEYAEKCEREKCLCSTHTNFVIETTNRLNGAQDYIQRIRENIRDQEQRAVEHTKTAFDLSVEVYEASDDDQDVTDLAWEAKWA